MYNRTLGFMSPVLKLTISNKKATELARPVAPSIFQISYFIFTTKFNSSNCD